MVNYCMQWQVSLFQPWLMEVLHEDFLFAQIIAALTTVVHYNVFWLFSLQNVIYEVSLYTDCTVACTLPVSLAYLSGSGLYLNIRNICLDHLNVICHNVINFKLTLCCSAYQPIIDAVRTVLMVKSDSAG